MSDDEIQVTIGADASQLIAQTELARAQFAKLQAEMRALANDMIATGRAADADLRQKLGALAGTSLAAKDQLGELEKAFGSLGGAAGGGHGAGAGISFYTREFHALMDELTSGRVHQAQGTFANLALTFVQGQPGLAAYAAAAAAAGAAFAYLGYEAGQSNIAVQRLTASAESGRFSSTGAEALKLRDQFVGLADVSKKTATDILASFDQLGAGGRDLAISLVPVAQAMAQAKGIELDKAYGELLKTFVNLKTEGRAYLDTITSLTVAEREHWQQLVDTGKAGDAALFVARALREQYPATTAAVVGNTAAYEQQRAALYSGAGAVDDYGRAIEPLAEGEKRVADATQSMGRAFDEAGERARALMNASDVTAAHLREDAEAIESSVNTLSSGAKKIDAEMATIRMQMAASLGDPKATDGLQETYRRLNQMKLENGQKSGDPMHLDRDALKQDEDALKHFDDTARTSDQERLTGHIAMLKQMLGAEELTVAQRHTLQQDLESSEKQLYDSQSKAGVKAARDVLGANEASVEGQIRALEDQTRWTLEHLEAQVKLKQITEEKKAALAQAALKAEEQAVDLLYAKELALAGLSLTKKQEISNKELAFNDQASLKMQEAQNKAAEATEKSWESATKAINSAFDSQIEGLLRGTTTWQQATKNVLAQLTTDTIKYFVNSELQSLENTVKSNAQFQQIVMSHIAGNAAMTASDSGAAGASSFAWAASALKSIMASSAETFAGVFGFLAPVMGPLAAGPAAAAQATVASVAGSVASADIGMWNAPSDMLTLVHHNELIMPAAQASAFRDMLSGGARGAEAGQGSNVTVAPQMHFHNSAIDSSGLAGMFRNNGNSLMKAVEGAVRDGAHLGLRRINR